MFDSGNPVLRSVTPGVLAQGGEVTLKISADGVGAGATVRVTGSGVDQELALKADGTVTIDLSGADLGSALVRVVNHPTPGSPPLLVSNAIAVSIQTQTVLRGVTPGTVKQDGPQAALALVGANFAQGATATFTLPSGVSRTYSTTFVSSSSLTVEGFVPGELAVGSYALTVSNPGSSPTTALKFTVTEAAPTLSSITPQCATANSILEGVASGENLYPTSVVHVTGGSIVDSPLTTACMSGTDALGRCVGGLRVTQNLAGVPGNCYTVKVVNPGLTPQSSGALQFRVQADCNSGNACE
jgi:hypothetical protein